MKWVKNLKNKSKKVDMIFWGEILVIAAMIIPVLLVSLHALPAEDDFFKAYVMKLKVDENQSYFQSAFNQAKGLYNTVGGYVFANFLSYFFSPLLRGGVKAVQGTAFIINLFFYFSLCFFVINVLISICNVKNKRVTFAICILILFAFTNDYNNSQVLTWYCVLVEYVLLVAGALWGIYFFLKALQSGKKAYALAAALIGFLMSGGALNVTALNCGMYLVVGIIGFWIYKQRRTAVICFVSALAGGIINAVAPGNFNRHDSMSNTYSIGGAIKSAVFHTWSRTQYLLIYTPFILLVVVVFLLALKYINFKRGKYLNPILILGAVFLGVIVVNFPVCLGYNGGSFPQRCVWVEDCWICLGIFSWAIYLSAWIKNYYGEITLRRDVILCIVISGLFFCCNLGAVSSLDSLPVVEMTKQLASGEIKEYSEYWEGVFEEIESTDCKEVVIYRDEIMRNEFVHYPGIDGHIDNWINSAAAHYYDKDWICIMTERPEQ